MICKSCGKDTYMLFHGGVCKDCAIRPVLKVENAKGDSQSPGK
jgi:hypothetical protein